LAKLLLKSPADAVGTSVVTEALAEYGTVRKVVGYASNGVENLRDGFINGDAEG
jgi:hypothetical protein